MYFPSVHLRKGARGVVLKCGEGGRPLPDCFADAPHEVVHALDDLFDHGLMHPLRKARSQFGHMPD